MKLVLRTAVVVSFIVYFLSLTCFAFASFLHPFIVSHGACTCGQVRALMLHATGKEGAPGAAPIAMNPLQAGPQQASWGGACVALAFRSLKLIVDDFLEVSDH